MIKVTFKKPQEMLFHLGKDNRFITNQLDYRFLSRSDTLILYAMDELRMIKSIQFGCESEMVPKREDILKKLGISKKQDELNQIEWSKSIEHVKPTDL